MVGRFPQFGIESAEKAAGIVIPEGPEVIREFREPLEPVASEDWDALL